MGQHKVLIITSSGGGGHLQLANAKKQEVLDSNPDALVIQRDIMIDWLWKGFGNFILFMWRDAQTRGHVKTQKFFGTIGIISIAGAFLWPHIFYGVITTLFREDIDRVIDTQGFGTTATVKAIRLFNWWKNKKIILEKVLSDLPTNKTRNFFLFIKSLTAKDRNFFRLTTPEPLLEKGQTNEAFWLKYCKLTSKELNSGGFNVRKSFLKYTNEVQNYDPIKLKIVYGSEAELTQLRKTVNLGSSIYEEKLGALEFYIPTHVKVFTILLGSQPASTATLNYVREFVELARGIQSPPVYLFVFCSHFHSPLFKSVVDCIQEIQNYPSVLTVIPMSFQSEETIASLFFRSNMTCTRSGGQTSMELLCAGRGSVWIHSEAKGANLLKGIPVWEEGNAVYLQRHKNAQLVTPTTFAPLARDLLTK